MTSLFECRIKYAKIDQNSGRETTVTELYLIDAISYTEAEERIHKEMEQCISGEFIIKGIKPTNYSEVVLDLVEADKYFKVKTIHETIDDNGVEKKITIYTLFLADNIKDALDRAIKNNEAGMYNYTIISISETAIIDFFHYDLKTTADVVDGKSKAYKEN